MTFSMTEQSLHFEHKKKEGVQTVWWDEKHHVARNILTGHVSDEAGIWLHQKVIQITKDHKPTNWLVDITDLKTATPNTRRIMKQMNQMPGIGRIAFVGAKPFARIMTNFIVKAAGKEKEIKHVATEEDAVAWLQT